MKYVNLSIGLICILIVTAFNFWKDNIFDLLLNDDKIVVSENEYFVKTKYNFLSNYTDDAHNKQELINYLYYIVNSGASEADGSCAEEYTTCISDIESIAENTELLSLINNFVHPYNTFNKITFSYDKKGNFNIIIDKVYTPEEIDTINKKVDEVIENNITADMDTYNKIKTIHDYIIDNTEYDTLKGNDINDSTYKSNTAYGPLIEGYGICSGYSDAMSIFLNKFYIDNLKISNETHIWNLVKVGGRWVHLDLTWDDPIYETNINRDTYFLIDYNTLTALDDKTHNFDHNIFSEGLS